MIRDGSALVIVLFALALACTALVLGTQQSRERSNDRDHYRVEPRGDEIMCRRPTSHTCHGRFNKHGTVTLTE